MTVFGFPIHCVPRGQAAAEVKCTQKQLQKELKDLSSVNRKKRVTQFDIFHAVGELKMSPKLFQKADLYKNPEKSSEIPNPYKNPTHQKTHNPEDEKPES